jgi:signal transduction histidine kinase
MKKLSVILFLVIGMSLAHGQQHSLDSLKRVLLRSPDEKKIEVYQDVILKLWLNHPDSAMFFAREAMRHSKTTPDLRTKAIASRLLGGVHYYKGNYDSTIKYSHESLALAEAIQDSALMTSAMNNAGLAYYNVGSFPEALEFLLRALNLKITIKQTYGLAQTLNNIGLVYTELKDYDKARSYFVEATKLAREQFDRDQILYSLNNTGFTYIDENNLVEARKCFNEGLKLAATMDNTIWRATAYSGSGQISLLRDSLHDAKLMFKKALELSASINDQSGIAESYSFFANIYIKSHKLDSAYYFLRKSMAVATTIGERDMMMINYDLMKDLFVQRRRYDSALYYQTKFVALKDSVFGKNLARSIKDIQLQIEREQARSKLEAKDVEIRKITVQTYVLIGVVGLFVLVSFFLYQSYKEHRRLSANLAQTNAEITAQKEQIHVQRDELALSHDELEQAKEVIHQKNLELSKLNDQLQNTVDVRTRELEQANQELKLVNLELDNFIYRSSHDIRGPLVRLLGICHVALLDLHDEKAKEYFSMFYESAQQLNEIFDRLKIVSHINEVNVQYVKVNFNELLTGVLDKLKTMHGFPEIEIVNENRANDWYTDPFLLELVLLNMIENSIRFQKREGGDKKFIKVKTLKNGKNLQIKIIDNGIGIQEADMENLYKMFSKSARDHRNIGLGLYIVKQCLNKLNGSINLVENEEGYTEFEIVHPVYS